MHCKHPDDKIRLDTDDSTMTDSIFLNILSLILFKRDGCFKMVELDLETS